jgi:hypothetical protein
MRDASDPEVEGVVGLLGRGVRVPSRDRDAALAQPLDERVRPGQLRRERHLRHCTRVEQPVEQRDIRPAQMGERVRSRAIGREERPLEVRAEDARARCIRRHRPQRLDGHLLRRRDERRLVGGHAGEQQCLARAAVIVPRG